MGEPQETITIASSTTAEGLRSINPISKDNLACYHCGLPVDKPNEFLFTIQGVARDFCCTGCQAVASLIHQGGLDNFYQYRSQLNSRPDGMVADYTLYDRDDIQASFVNIFDDQVKTAYLLLDGITCAACVWLIEKYMNSIDGVSSVRVNAVTHQCVISWESEKQALSFLMEQLMSIGYRPQPFTRQEQYKQQQDQQKKLLLRLGLAGFGMMQVGMVAIALYAGAAQGIESQWVQLLRWVSLLVATPIVFFSAQPFWTSAWRSLRSFFSSASLKNKSHYLTMDVPVSIAILLAYFASAWATFTQSGEVYFDSISMFTFFLLLGRYLEARLRYRNQQTMGAMADLLPITVNRVLSANEQSTKTMAKQHNEESIIPLVELEVGDTIRIYSGDTIPCDGLVIDGSSAVIESILTGESEPVTKHINDTVIAGTQNTEGSLLIEVTAVGKNTRLSAITQLVQEAQQDKPAVQQVADHVASYFVAAVLVVSVVVFTSWYFVKPESALWVTLSVLVVTCPCALSLATPTALTAAVAVMRKQGLLVLKGHVIETLTKTSKVVFDKTGTLTYGRPTVNDIIILDEHFSENKILAIATALEKGSSHPVAKAFDRYQELISIENIVVEHSVATTGAGVAGTITMGSSTIGSSTNVSNTTVSSIQDEYRLGKPDYALALTTKTAPKYTLPEAKGQWVLLTKNGQMLAWIGLSDEIRESALPAIERLKTKKIDIKALSGDHTSEVARVAEQLTIDYLANQTPEDKLNYITREQEQHRLIMVGDGINDVPVLAGADVSIAMDSATDFARTHADSVLLRGDLTTIAAVIDTAKRSKSIIRQNLSWALAYNLLALPLAAFGFIPPYLAAIGMSASSLIVVINALRLYR
ncbi:MAG: heavy metal translocating P-type ATPase [Cellvibrionaceae bacterium]